MRQIVLSSALLIVLMIGAPTVQAFTGTSKDGYDAGYSAAKAGKPYPLGSNFTEKYKLGYDFGYRDGIQGGPYDPIKKYPNKDSEQEDGVPYDSQGRPCIFGPDHDQCHDRYFETIPGTSNYIDYHSAYKVGYTEGFKGDVYDHLKADSAPSISWGSGYTEGWTQGCMDAATIQHTIDQAHICSR